MPNSKLFGEKTIKDEYFTPKFLLDRIKQDVFMGPIDTDPATDASNPTGAQVFYTKEDDGLSKEWYGNIFLNPPYGKVAGLFASKAIEEAKKSADNRIVLLLAARPDSKWQQNLYLHSDEVLFLSKRLRFEYKGSALAPAPFASCLVAINCCICKLADIGLPMVVA